MICSLAVSFCTLMLLGASTIGTDLVQPVASWLHRPAACPLPWLPVLLADAPPTNRRRLVDNVFTTKDDLWTAVREYDDDVASAEAKYGPIGDWDVSRVTDMSYLFFSVVFSGLQNFNAYISN